MHARRLALLAGTAALLGLAGACSPVVTFAPVDEVELRPPEQTSVIHDAEGRVLAELHGEINREVVELEAMPGELRDAVLAIEDARFEDHVGVDVRGLGRAVLRNATHGEVVEGGSTITQQLAKNTVTGGEPTLERKIEEASVALRLEAQLGKAAILERYLNEVYFGHGAYGVQATARRYFSRDVEELGLAESALLAGVLQSPSTHDPLADPEAAKARRDLVLEQMARHGFITEEEAQAARTRDLDLQPQDEADEWAAPYFVDHVLRELQHDERFGALGATPTERAEAIFRGGLEIETTLDPRWQASAEEAVEATLPEPDDPRAGVVAIDPQTGEVRALVGGRDWHAEDDDSSRFNLATQAARQPASAFKPIVLAAALEHGWTLDDQLEAPAEEEFEPVPGEPEPWTVSNFEDRDHGIVSLREATTNSVNVAFAHLAQELGAARIAETARDLGVQRDLAETRAIALGSAEVSVLEMASVQATLASGGIRREPTVVREITGPDGETVYQRGAIDGERVLDETTAWQVTDALTEVVSRGTGERAHLERPTAGKTGTSQRRADAWFTGFTPDLAAAVWIGFPDGTRAMVPPTTRTRVQGGTWPAELFARFGLGALGDLPASEFAVPEERLVHREVDVTRGCLPTRFTSPEDVEERAFLEGEQPTEPCEDAETATTGDVPDVAGVPEEEAVTRLRDEGFAVEVEPLFDASRPPGVAIEQQPAPGDDVDLPDGWEAVVRVSSADRTRVTVPDVLSASLDEAEARLRDEGFAVDVVQQCPDGGETCTGARHRPGAVWDVTPGHGRELPIHDRVEVFAYPEP
ncbi:PBP1A family penicillin-binding protein [Egibacter rhizosphaerae]|nr:PBP1A family penicillin-binding protein [Egibacter rhizosphaerae]